MGVFNDEVQRGAVKVFPLLLLPLGAANLGLSAVAQELRTVDGMGCI